MDPRRRMPTVRCLIGALLTLASPIAQAQTYNVLHRFTGSDGSYPVAGVMIDAAGNLYGTASTGGSQNMGTVYRLEYVANGWVFHLLYSFQGLSEHTTDGGNPYSRPVIGPDGTLYGTTHFGGNGQGCRELHGCGTVYNLKPRSGNSFGPWQETVIFQLGNDDGANPDTGDLVFDRNGNLYGTARNAGLNGWGTVYELTLHSGRWIEQAIHRFAGSPDGAWPLEGLVADQAGSLYSTTSAGGTYGWGTVYKLTPVGSEWTENILHDLQNGIDGRTPVSGVVFDQSGNLYGATQTGGAGGGGTVFELTLQSNGSWNINTLYGLSGPGSSGSYGSIVMDNAGNLYGTTSNGGSHRCGSVYKLTWSNGAWTYNSLHDFTCGDDGGTPYGRLALDSNGNLYGTAYAGGINDNGVVFEITP